MIEDIKALIKHNFRDILGIINSDFIVYWFLLSFIFFVLPLINIFSLLILNFFLVLSFRYFIKEAGINKDFLEFLLNPCSSNRPDIFKLENMFKIEKNEVTEIFFNSLITFAFTNIWVILFLIVFYLFLMILKTSFFAKSFVVFILILLMSTLIFIQFMVYVISPLILLKQIESKNIKELIYNLFYIWQDFYDENTLIFFRSLFFDLFWRVIVIFFCVSPILIFLMLFYKVLITNLIFSIFMGWIFLCLIFGIFFTFFAIDFVGNYYIYFGFV